MLINTLFPKFSFWNLMQYQNCDNTERYILKTDILKTQTVKRQELVTSSNKNTQL